MNSITSDMKYLQSLLAYAQKYGTIRKYDKRKTTLETTSGSTAVTGSRNPLRTGQEERKLIADIHLRKSHLDPLELYAIHEPQKVYGGSQEGWIVEKKEALQAKPCRQMQYSCWSVQIDRKVVPRRCFADAQPKLHQYTAIDEYSRYPVLGAYAEQCFFSFASRSSLDTRF